MCGELLELRIETAWFQKNYIWEPQLFALTNIGILKFVNGNIATPPVFISLKELTVDLLPTDAKHPCEMIFRLAFTQQGQNSTEMFLSSEHPDQIIDWINSIKLAVKKFNPQLFKSRSQVKVGFGTDTVENFNSLSSIRL